MESAPEDTPLTTTSTPYPNPASAEAESLANHYYDCMLSNEELREEFLSEMEESLFEDGATREEAREAAQAIIESRAIIVLALRQVIESEGSSGLEEFAEVCDEGQEPIEGPADTFGRYFRGETLHLSVAGLERVPELRYSTIDPGEIVRRWSLRPSAPGNELVLIRLKVENHTADSATFDIGGDAAMLRATDGASYRPVSVSETVWRDFRGGSQALVRVDKGQCFDGARTLVDAGTTILWQNEAGSGQYLDFEDESIAVGPGGRVELNPGRSISYEFSDPGVYSYACSGSKPAEWPAEIWVTPSGEQESVTVRSVLFLEGDFELQEGYGLDGYLVFEAPVGKEFHELAWRAGDGITIPLKAQASQGDTQAGPTDLPEYAALMAGGPGAIYIGDINQLVGSAPTVDQGDFGGNVPLESLEGHLWLYESPFYQELLEKAGLTDPTPMTYDGPAITIQHVCINRALLPCQLMETYLAPNLRERTNGKLELITSSFPELGLAGPDTLSLVADGTLDSVTVYAGYVAGQIPEIDIQNLWGLYSSREQEFDATLAILKDIEELVLAETGSVVMNHSWYAGNDQFLFCRERIDSLDGFAGKRICSHSAALSDWLNGMGAEPGYVAFAEVYDDLDRGILDCGVTGADAAYGQRWYEVLDYMIGPLFSYPSNNNVISAEKWASIPEDLQKIIIEEAARSELEALRLAAIQFEQGVTGNQDAGLELIPFSPEILNHSFETAAMERVIPAWMRRMGPTGDQFIAGTFNPKLGPIVDLRIEPDGSAVKIPPAEGAGADDAPEQDPPARNADTTTTDSTSASGSSPERPYLYKPISPPTIPADISWLWNPAQDGFRVMEWEFTIHNDAADWPGHYGYSLNTYNVISSVGFLFGLDTDRRGNRLRFQRQGASDQANARYSADCECFAYASLEYEYVEVECSYDWGRGEYRARIAPDGQETDGEWYGLWITNLNNNETTWAGSLKFPLQEGTTAFFPRAASTNIGLYGASMPFRPIDLPQWHVSVGIPQGDGIAAIGGLTRYPSDGSENALLNSNVRYDSSEERVHLVLGGATERITDAAQILFE